MPLKKNKTYPNIYNIQFVSKKQHLPQTYKKLFITTAIVEKVVVDILHVRKINIFYEKNLSIGFTQFVVSCDIQVRTRGQVNSLINVTPECMLYCIYETTYL